MAVIWIQATLKDNEFIYYQNSWGSYISLQCNPWDTERSLLWVVVLGYHILNTGTLNRHPFHICSGK